MIVASSARSVSEEGPRVWVAGFWRRVGSAIVDALLVAVVALPLCALTSQILGRPIPRLLQLGPDIWLDAMLGGDPLLRGLGFLTGVLGLAYVLMFHGLRGQTLGQRLFGLRLIDGHGHRPSASRVLARTLLYVPSVLLFGGGILWIAVDREKQGLHDWLADTYVILESRSG